MAGLRLPGYLYVLKFLKMKKISFILGLILGLGINASIAQINNAKTVSVAVNGNCGMCKKTIESNGSEGKISKVSWDSKQKQAEITFDTTKTSEAAVLKKIAQAGYDNAQFRAPDDVYANLHECCRYDRSHEIKGGPHAQMNHNDMPKAAAQHGDAEQAKGLAPVFQSYLGLKDALVGSDQKKAALAAEKLGQSIQKVDMKSLADAEHTQWMKLKGSLEKASESIAKDSKLDGQRNTFIGLSNHMYELAKTSKSSQGLYWQYCPMANNNKGAHWLSKEEAIKNPYYGSKMMSCGEVKEKI